MAVKIKPHGFIQRCTVHLFNFCTGGECTGIADQNINPAKSGNTFNYRRSNRFIIGDITNDTDMTRELKASMTNPGAPAPSVEAILHALIPLKYVDHTHTDAVVAISNTADGEDRQD